MKTGALTLAHIMEHDTLTNFQERWTKKLTTPLLLPEVRPMEKSLSQPETSPFNHPIPATIAAVIRDGNVLLVRRRNPPDANHWGFPGGKIDFGETTESAALRELHEETGVQANVVKTFTAVDVFDHDDAGHIQQHFVLIAVLCQWISGEPVAGDDALDARWFPVESLEIQDLALSLDVVEVAKIAAKLNYVYS